MTEGEQPTAAPLPKATERKSEARLAAVQVLYQLDMKSTDKDAGTLIQEAVQSWDGHDDEEDVQINLHPDARFLTAIVNGTLSRQEQIDILLTQYLAEGWSLQRLGPVMRSILRAGVYELMELLHIPSSAIIHEYVLATEAYSDEADVKFVNGILDTIAEKVRE